MLQMDELQNDAARFSTGTFYYVLATLHVYGDSVKDALEATENHSSLEL
jgi:hypothetical protein